MFSAVRTTISLALLLVLVGGAGAQEESRASGMRFAAESEGVTSPLNLLERPANLVVEGVSLLEAFFELENRSGVPVAYSPAHFPMDREVTCPCGDLTVDQALGVLLSGIAHEVTEVAGQLVVRRAEEVAPPSRTAARDWVPDSIRWTFEGGPPMDEAMNPPPVQGSVTGRVVDEGTGQPLSGTQVHIPEEGVGALTRSDGRYLLQNVPVGTHTVLAERIGYQNATAEVTVGEGETIELGFQLREQALALDEIVVTGTPAGAQKRSLGNSVSNVDADQAMETAPATQLSELMNARVPGMNVRPAGGVGTGARLKVRGTSSLTLDTQPLIYVDGVRVDNAIATGPGLQGGNVTSRLNDLNLADIENIEIIKGPAAATLYGTEASSGVIQIITKSGSPGDISLGLTVRQGANWWPGAAEKFPTNWGFADGELQPINIIESERARGNEVFQTGHLQSYALSARGGSDVFGFYASGTFERNSGIEEPNVVRRYSGRTNVSFSPHATVDANASIGLNVVRTGLAREESPTQSVWGAGVRANPAYLDFDPPRRGWFAVPPEVLWETYDISQDVDRFTSSLQINHTPTDWLVQRLTVGGDFVDEKNSVLVPHLPPELGRFYSTDFARGFKNVNGRDVTNTTVDYAATVSLPLTEEISSQTSVGWQYYRKFVEFFDLSGDRFPAPGVKTVTSAAIRLGGDDFVENSTVGTYLQQEFSYQNRIFVTGALRGDDNSAFGRDFEFQIYPKLSASWVISEEPFWNVGPLDAFRLRAAYGASGQQPDAFAAIRTFEPVTGTEDEPAATPQSLGNPELGPERGEELEVGFEAGAFEDRFGFDFTFYNQVTRDAILLSPVAPSSGFPGSQFINAGEVRNRGVELMTNVRALDRGSFDLDLGVNLTWNENEVLSLDGLGPVGFTGTAPGGPTAEHREGFPAWSFFLRRVVSADLNEEGRAENVLCDGGTGKRGLEPGGPAVPCEEAPRVYMGKIEPDWQGALTADVTLRDRIRLGTLFDFQLGRTNFAENDWARCSIYRICRVNVAPEEFAPEYVAEVERAGSAPIRSIYYQDASFMKLREVSLNYRVPEGWTQRFGSDQGSITVAARNLYTWTDWPQFDPESTKLALQGGFDQAMQPPLTSLVATVNLTF